VRARRRYVRGSIAATIAVERRRGATTQVVEIQRANGQRVDPAAGSARRQPHGRPRRAESSSSASTSRPPRKLESPDRRIRRTAGMRSEPVVSRPRAAAAASAPEGSGPTRPERRILTDEVDDVFLVRTLRRLSPSAASRGFGPAHSRLLRAFRLFREPRRPHDILRPGPRLCGTRDW